MSNIFSHNILSQKAKKIKKADDEKPYFENTHQVFTPSWINYKNPKLDGEERDEEEGQEEVKGKALLKKIYGGSCWKGYEQFGMKEKKGRKVPNCVPKKGGCGNLPCSNKKVVKHYDKVVDNYTDVINHLDEHLKEKAGDPKDASQSKFLKKEVKRVNELHLLPASRIGAGDPLYKVSNPREVQKKAFEIYGKDAIVYKSSNPKKKYQMLDQQTGKWVFFGDAKMEDFTKHLDEARQDRYLKRALNIKGKWRQNAFSPNVLSILLLW